MRRISYSVSIIRSTWIREHPEWTDVVDVEIIRGANSNWNARFTMGGFKPVPKGAFIVVDELQKQFDLA